MTVKPESSGTNTGAFKKSALVCRHTMASEERIEETDPMLLTRGEKLPDVSLLIAVYNNEEVVEKTLTALSGQSWRFFEVIVCDDGSGPAIKALIQEAASLFPAGLHHVRQSDKGFRKCRILNRGIHKARSDYIIVLDPDCIPHRHFVKAHIEEREKGYYLSGRRVNLGKALTRSLMNGSVTPDQLAPPLSFLGHALRDGGCRHVEAGIYIPKFLRQFKKARPLALKGCNMSFWKKDIECVNGFEELFEMPGGGEDTDLKRRFDLMGLNSKSVKHAAVCYHMYHKRIERDMRVKDIAAVTAGKNSAKAIKGLYDA